MLEIVDSGWPHRRRGGRACSRPSAVRRSATKPSVSGAPSSSGSSASACSRRSWWRRQHRSRRPRSARGEAPAIRWIGHADGTSRSSRSLNARSRFQHHGAFACAHRYRALVVARERFFSARDRIRIPAALRCSGAGVDLRRCPGLAAHHLLARRGRSSTRALDRERALPPIMNAASASPRSPQSTLTLSAARHLGYRFRAAPGDRPGFAATAHEAHAARSTRRSPVPPEWAFFVCAVLNTESLAHRVKRATARRRDPARRSRGARRADQAVGARAPARQLGARPHRARDPSSCVPIPCARRR